MILTIINGIMLLVMIVVFIMMYSMINSFGELIVRFIEQNQEHFRNQKHLVTKSSDLAQSLKKAPNIVSSMKGLSRKFENIATKLDQHISRMEK